MEGKLNVDTSKSFLINGVDFSNLVQKATISYKMEFKDGTECIPLSFSASMLSKKNCHKIDDEIYTVNDEFYNEMKQFGDSFFIFNAYQFIETLKTEFIKTNTDHAYHSITYINKNDFDKIHDYYARLDAERKNTAHLFLKDYELYHLQNEWRMILLNGHNRYSIDKNGGINVQTRFRSETSVFDIESLKTLQCSEEYLFN